MTANKKWWFLGFLVFAFLALYFLSPVLMPFVVGALLAYLGDPIVTRLKKIKCPRTLGVTAVFVFFVVIIFGFLLLFIPELVKQIEGLIKQLPVILNWLQTVAAPWLQAHVSSHISFDVPTLKQFFTKHLSSIGNIANWLVQAVSYSSGKVVAWSINIVLIIVVAFYLMRDWSKLMVSLRELLPRSSEQTSVRLASECNDVVGSFLRGQLLVMLALAIYYSVALSFVGLNFSVLVGLTIGVFTIVPYLGTIVSVLLAGLIAVFQFHAVTPVVIVYAVIAVGYTLENFVLVPLLIGDKIGLHPVAVIFAAMVGGELFGFTGVLIALPVAAVIMVFLREIQRRYVASDVYQ